MYRVLIRYSFNGDDGGVTTDFWNGLSSLGFHDAGTGLKRADGLSAFQLEDFFSLLGSHGHGMTTAAGVPVTVDHFIVIVETV